MPLFLLTFFLVYGGFHLYFFLKVRAAFSPGPAVQFLLIVLLLLGLMTPFIIRLSERYGLAAFATLVSWVGYLWMAILLLFVASSLLFDLYRLALWLAGLIFPADVGAFFPTPRSLFVIPFAVALLVSGYGIFEARQIRTERIEIRSAKIPKAVGRIRIVQVSDVHVGVLIRGKRLAGMLQKVLEAAPDLLVSTGDLVDGQLDSMAEAAAQFRELRPRYGKFAVTGNHEFYAGIDASLDFMGQSGFVPLRDDVANIADAVDLVGVDDLTIRRFIPGGGVSDREVLSRGGSGHFKILLKHQPVVERDAPGAFDLQLSGHTHQGQIFPFSLITGRFFAYHGGNYRLEKGALIHVNRGTGTWGPPVRFLVPPEITVIDLIPE